MEGKGINKGNKVYYVHMYLLPKMTRNCVYCKHVNLVNRSNKMNFKYYLSPKNTCK